MCCILRVAGELFDVDLALIDCSLKPYKVYRRGEKAFRTSKRINEHSGASFDVSDADGGEVPVQVRDAIEFLQTHACEIRKLASAPGVQHAFLDFKWDFPDSSPAQWNFFPPELLTLCVEIGVSLCVSVYHESDPSSDADTTPTHSRIDSENGD